MTLTLPPAVGFGGADQHIDYGHLEPVSVHFDDFDAMGVVHNVRYALLLERAMVAFWTRHGHTFDQGRPTTPDAFNVVKEFSISYHTPIRGTGEIGVHFWIERLGDSSAVYAFRLLSADGQTVFAEGRRVVIKLDQATLVPSPWTPAGRATAETLLRPQAPAAIGLTRRSGPWPDGRRRTRAEGPRTLPRVRPRIPPDDG